MDIFSCKYYGKYFFKINMQENHIVLFSLKYFLWQSVRTKWTKSLHLYKTMV